MSYRIIDPATDDPRDVSRLFLSLVVPRPIGWTSTQSRDGALNVAPFSFFNAVGVKPPMIMLSIGPRRGTEKDTLRNIRETGEFVVHLVDEQHAGKMNVTSGEYDPEVSEFESAGLEATASLKVKPPRIASAPIALESRLTQLVELKPTGYTMVVGEVIQMHLREELIRRNGLVDATKLSPIARMGGDEYSKVGTIFEMHRPQV